MTTAFRVEPLSFEFFKPLFALSDDALRARGAERMFVDAKPGYPCRVSLVDAEIGERVILIQFMHHDVTSPYRGSGPIFVREFAQTIALEPNQIPNMLRHRQLSVRAFDSAAMMVAAKTAGGETLEDAISECFNNPNVEYLHIHNAAPGCYNCGVRRA